MKIIKITVTPGINWPDEHRNFAVCADNFLAVQIATLEFRGSASWFFTVILIFCPAGMVSTLGEN